MSFSKPTLAGECARHPQSDRAQAVQAAALRTLLAHVVDTRSEATTTATTLKMLHSSLASGFGALLLFTCGSPTLLSPCSTTLMYAITGFDAPARCKKGIRFATSKVTLLSSIPRPHPWPSLTHLLTAAASPAAWCAGAYLAQTHDDEFFNLKVTSQFLTPESGGYGTLRIALHELNITVEQEVEFLAGRRNSAGGRHDGRQQQQQ